MSRLIRIMIMASVLSALTAATASATTGPAMVGVNGTPGVASNTGAVSGNSATYAAHVLTSGGFTVSCTDASFDVSATATTSVTIQPTYSGCSLLISGTPVYGATIATPCSWQIAVDHGTFDSATGAATGGTVATGCTTALTISAINCEIDFAAQTRPGISSQNINAAGGNDASATPWGSKVIANVTGLAYTVPSGKTCPGITTSGTFAYAGVLAVHNVFGTL